MTSRNLAFLQKFLKPQSSRLWKGVPVDAPETRSKVQIFDNLERYKEEAQKLNPSLTSDFLETRVKTQKNNCLEIFNGTAAEHLLFLDTSEFGTFTNIIENELLTAARAQIKTALTKVSTEKNQQAEVVLNVDNLELARTIVNDIEYSNYQFDLRLPESEKNYPKPDVDAATALKSEQDAEFGNKVTVSDFYIDSEAINEQELEEINLINNSVALTRNILNSRPDMLNPQTFMQNARLFAENNNLRHEIIVGDELLEKKLNLIHAVGKGAKTPSALVILHHDGNPQDPDNR